MRGTKIRSLYELMLTLNVTGSQVSPGLKCVGLKCLGLKCLGSHVSLGLMCLSLKCLGSQVSQSLKCLSLKCLESQVSDNPISYINGKYKK